MVIVDNDIIQPFNESCCLDKPLVMKILRSEEILWKSDFGQAFHKNSLNFGLEDQKAIQREVLRRNGFSNDDEDLHWYRSIIKYYYFGPENYDTDVMDSVHYYRHNRLLYYKTPEIVVGQTIRSECNIPILVSLGDCTDQKISISKALSKVRENWNYGIIHSFSKS